LGNRRVRNLEIVMNARVKAAFGMMLVMTSLGTACSDTSPTAPSAITTKGPVAEQALLGGLVGALTNTLTNLLVPPVKRLTPLANDVSWSFTVGPAGGVSRRDDVGLLIAVPLGALSSTKTITVTALKGSPVAYKFEPHGLVFNKKVVLTQDLRGTSAGGLLSGLTSLIGGLLGSSLQGAYFSTDRLEMSGDLAKVNELIPALLSTLTNTASFGIQHFSGYILASGRGDDSAGSGY